MQYGKNGGQRKKYMEINGFPVKYMQQQENWSDMGRNFSLDLGYTIEVNLEATATWKASVITGTTASGVDTAKFDTVSLTTYTRGQS